MIVIFSIDHGGISHQSFCTGVCPAIYKGLDRVITSVNRGKHQRGMSVAISCVLAIEAVIGLEETHKPLRDLW